MGRLLKWNKSNGHNWDPQLSSRNDKKMITNVKLICVGVNTMTSFISTVGAGQAICLVSVNNLSNQSYQSLLLQFHTMVLGMIVHN